MSQDRHPHDHVLDLDASLATYEEFKAEEEAKEAQEVEEEIFVWETGQLAARELERVVSYLRDSTSPIKVLTMLRRVLPTSVTLLALQTLPLSQSLPPTAMRKSTLSQRKAYDILLEPQTCSMD
jgi:hypothetical protein